MGGGAPHIHSRAYCFSRGLRGAAPALNEQLHASVYPTAQVVLDGSPHRFGFVLLEALAHVIPRADQKNDVHGARYWPRRCRKVAIAASACCSVMRS